MKLPNIEKTSIIEQAERIGHHLEKIFLIFRNAELRGQYYSHDGKVCNKDFTPFTRRLRGNTEEHAS
jgi:hypothetical protein